MQLSGGRRSGTGRNQALPEMLFRDRRKKSPRLEKVVCCDGGKEEKLCDRLGGGLDVVRVVLVQAVLSEERRTSVGGGAHAVALHVHNVGE